MLWSELVLRPMAPYRPEGVLSVATPFVNTFSYLACRLYTALASPTANPNSRTRRSMCLNAMSRLLRVETMFKRVERDVLEFELVVGSTEGYPDSACQIASNRDPLYGDPSVKA